MTLVIIMKVLTAEDKVATVGKENEPRVDVVDAKPTKEELNRLVCKKWKKYKDY